MPRHHSFAVEAPVDIFTSGQKTTVGERTGKFNICSFSHLSTIWKINTSKIFLKIQTLPATAGLYVFSFSGLKTI